MFDSLRMTRRTTTERVGDELRRRIVDGTIRPGTALTEERLARAVGVSRNTIRESLALLVAEGLLTRSPTRRVLRVTQLSEADVVDIFIARRMIELAAVDAAPSASEKAQATLAQAVTEYEAAVGRHDIPALTDADLKCHRALVGLLGSRRVAEMHEALMSELRLAMLVAKSPDANSEQPSTHLVFYRLVVTGKIAEAREQLARRLDAAEAQMRPPSGRPIPRPRFDVATPSHARPIRDRTTVRRSGAPSSRRRRS
jgi:DNA-binding GntR family transcriptional regulator